MKKILLVLPIVLCSCQWVLTHPAEDAEIVKVVEEAGVDLYKYETGQPLGPQLEPKSIPQMPLIQ